jgi:hypothetical protein
MYYRVAIQVANMIYLTLLLHLAKLSATSPRLDEAPIARTG